MKNILEILVTNISNSTICIKVSTNISGTTTSNSSHISKYQIVYLDKKLWRQCIRNVIKSLINNVIQVINYPSYLFHNNETKELIENSIDKSIEILESYEKCEEKYEM